MMAEDLVSKGNLKMPIWLYFLLKANSKGTCKGFSSCVFRKTDTCPQNCMCLYSVLYVGRAASGYRLHVISSIVIFIASYYCWCKWVYIYFLAFWPFQLSLFMDIQNGSI